jgi:hypothetical protein
MTESGRGDDICPLLTRHDQLCVGAGGRKQCAAEQSHYISGDLPHGQLSQVLRACAGRREKELRIPDASLQGAQIGGLPCARNDDVNILISVRAKTFRQAIGGNDVILRKHDDERDSGGASRLALLLHALEARPRRGALIFRLWSFRSDCIGKGVRLGGAI